MRAAETNRGILRRVHDEAPPSTPSEQTEWIARARAGDRDAFGQLVQLHLSQVWRVVFRVVRRREDAEDVVQEVFLTAFRSIAAFRGESAFSTWLHSIAVSRALNHIQRASERLRRASRPLEALGTDGRSGEPLPEVERAAVASGPPRSVSPLRALETRELMRRLAARPACRQRHGRFGRERRTRRQEMNARPLNPAPRD